MNLLMGADGMILLRKKRDKRDPEGIVLGRSVDRLWKAKSPSKGNQQLCLTELEKANAK